MLDLARIQAITLDLDDTLWPVWPAIAQAELALQAWLAGPAPRTAALFADSAARLAIRAEVNDQYPELQHDLSALRHQAIALALRRCCEDTALADAAFEVFFAARNQVTFFADALPGLALLSARFPLVALSNGNADIHRIGIGGYFRAAVSAREFGVGKPDPRIFQAAAAAAGVAAEAVLHIGDDAALDVLAAQACGMQAAWLNRADQLWPYDQAPHATAATLTGLCKLMN